MVDSLKEHKFYWLTLLALLFAFISVGFTLSKINTDPNFFPSFTNRFFDNPSSFSKPPIVSTNKQKTYYSVVTTEVGAFKIKFLGNASIKNLSNYRFLAENRYYQDSTFANLSSLGLRVNFSELTDKRIKYLIEDEVNFTDLGFNEAQINLLKSQGYYSDPLVVSQKLEQYSVVADNNAKPSNNRGEFFILLSSNSDEYNSLQGKYTRMGEIIEGKDVLKNIYNLQKENPRTAIKVSSVSFYE